MGTPNDAGEKHADVCSDASSHVLDEDEDTARVDKKKQEDRVLGNIAASEDKAVTWLRLVLLLALVLSALGVGLAVYFYTHNQEENDFEEQFESDAQKILENIGTNFDLTLGATDNFMVNLVSNAQSTNQSFPFVVTPDFAVRASKVLALSDAFNLGYAPLVTVDTLEEWQNFTRDNHQWVDECIQAQKNDPNFHGPIVEQYNTTDMVIQFKYNPDGPFLPTWQSYPQIPIFAAPYNFDFITYDGAYVEDLYAVMKAQKAFITVPFGLITNISDPLEAYMTDITWQWASDFIPKDEDSKEPMSWVYYPIVKSIQDVTTGTATNSDTADLQSQGIIYFAMYWRETVKNVLPENSLGIIVVFEGCRGKVFTYQVDGADVSYVGSGDQHESKFDYLRHSALLTDLAGKNEMYTGLPLDSDTCPMMIHVYPSSKMLDIYQTSNPIWYTVVAVLIFLFTSILFLTYDMYVARRQRIIKDRAVASGAIVSSLFPEQVRNQIYQENEEKESADRNEKNVFSTNTSSVRLGSMAGNGTPTRSAGSRPIADVYHETTIFFADLAGFTAWSAKRTPVEVFELLEALYGAFDAIAKRRKVFKVETIGDCYVAVTGIPEPQNDHATIMCRFARDCMAKMNEVTRELSDSLGEDTMDLEMRVGLHSGPTTAGVLRGDKGRFQLFGDTVNTASRMESNGVKGRIHVSQATADCLIASGKEHWLKEREEKIFAKGLGEMVTYFVQINPGTARTGQSVGTMSLYSSDLASKPDDDDDEGQEEGNNNDLSV